MPTTRISEIAKEILREIAERSGESQQAVLEKAVEAYRRKLFLEESNAAFSALRSGFAFPCQPKISEPQEPARILARRYKKEVRVYQDLAKPALKSKPRSDEWEREKEERAAWDSTLADGLEED